MDILKGVSGDVERINEVSGPSHADSGDLRTRCPRREWSWLQKHAALVQVAVNAMMCSFSSAIIIPGFGQIADEFSKPESTVAYLVAVHVLCLGLGPFLWIPFGDVYGRRLILIYSMLLSLAANIGAGFARSYGTLMTARVFQSIGISSGYVVGSAVVVDIFEPDERGTKTGVWTLMVTIGPGIGPLIGAFVANACGWRWTLWLCAIVNGVELLSYLFLFRETMWIEGMSSSRTLTWVPRSLPGRRLRPRQFGYPLLFVQSPAIIITAFAYGITFGFSLVGLTNIEPLAFGALYKFGTIQNGLVFLSVLVGALIGEQVSGPLSDVIMKRYAKRCEEAGKTFRFEHRLVAAIPGYFLAPIGLIIFGVTLYEKTHWMAPCVGMGLTVCGLQIVTTVLTSYVTDCHRHQALAVSQFVSLIRQTLSFAVPFFNPPLNDRMGYAGAFGVEASILVVFYSMSLLVFWKGDKMRLEYPVRYLETSRPGNTQSNNFVLVNQSNKRRRRRLLARSEAEC